MSRLSYETAWTLIYDPVSGNRASMRSSLYSLGFRHIELAPTLAALADCIANRPPDLALCEAHGFEEDLCNLIQELRHGTAGYNPFVVIIVTAWEKSRTLAARVIDSGADDLLLRPFSPALLDQRIRNHVEHRKSFVITSDYVGPDRRKDEGRGSNIKRFNPPNSLKMKVLEGLSPEQVWKRLEGELTVARHELTAEKLRRDAFQICVLWRLLAETDGDSSHYEVDLPKLAALTVGIARRCHGTPFEAAKERCDTLLAAVKALQMEVDRASALNMLGQAALALSEFVDPEMRRFDRLSQIGAAVALIQARTENSVGR